MIEIVVASDVPKFCSEFFKACQKNLVVRVSGITNKVERVWPLCEAASPDAIVLATNDWSAGFHRQECPVFLLSDKRLVLKRGVWMNYQPLTLSQTSNEALLTQILLTVQSRPPLRPTSHKAC